MSLRHNTLWNLAGSGLPLIAAAALIPFMLQRLAMVTQTDGVGVHIDAKTSAFKSAATILNRTSFQIIQQ
jgi:hypothetical protein